MKSARKSHIPSSPPQVAGIKRPAASLLPAFEPLSSSPVALPRPAKRQALSPALRNVSATGNACLKYPTPVPTSTTGILSSSPPYRAPIFFIASGPESPNPAQTGPIAKQRAPLSAVPCVELSENGEPLLMGRSSNSSNYQLSANRLISRVHVKARYIPSPAPLAPLRVEIVCTGWNGLKLHSQGRTWELLRGDSFTSETEGAEILIDVQDARVMVQWPRRGPDALSLSEDSSWEESPQPAGRRSASVLLQSSPLRRNMAGKIGSPVSPCPATLSASSQRLQALMPVANDAVLIYEDISGDEGVKDGNGTTDELDAHVKCVSPHLDAGHSNASMLSELTSSFSSDLSDLDDKDPDEENDPIMHSFGPFGINLAGRLASITATSPEASHPKRRLQDVSRDIKSVLAAADSTPSSPTTGLAAPAPVPPEFDTTAIQNHAANQLAFSRLSSTPISTILSNLPATEKRNGELTEDVFKTMLDAMSCVGAIPRQGKDASGKTLEREYYYILDKDTDEHRRSAVVSGLGRPSLRNCRKQHKQYYWKRPKTP